MNICTQPSWMHSVFLFLLSHVDLANTWSIKTDFDIRDPFQPLAERAVLIGSTAHDSTFGEAFLSQRRRRGAR